MNTGKPMLFRFINRKETLLYLILFIAGISLLGWFSGKMGLATFSLKYIPIAPATAVNFIVLCILSISHLSFEKSRLVKLIELTIILLVVLFCLLIFLNYLFNFKWDIENIFISNPVKFGDVLTGRMSPITSLLFIFICISLLSIKQKNSSLIKYIGGSFSLLSGLISSVLIIGYLYKAPFLYGSQIIPVSLPSTICFILFSITLLRVYELKFWTYNFIKDNKVSNRLFKWFLPVGIFIIILQGYLISNFSLIVNNPPLFVALTLFIVIPVTILLIFRVSSIIGIKLLTAEQTLKESEEKLRQLNLDKDRFISILGHDLKSPFNNILGFSKELIEDIRNLNIDEIEDIVKNINKSARITNNLLEDILMWARTQQGNIPFKPQKLRFKDICKNILETLTTNAETKNLTINCLAEDDLIVFADRDMTKTILRNLLSNAIKFTKKGGNINISAERTDSNVTISVSDNGVGIPPDNLTMLFDISEVLTTKGTEKETGTGLGLLLCKEFVEKHGGKIWVESEIGKGSNFKLTLPILNSHDVDRNN